MPAVFAVWSVFMVKSMESCPEDDPAMDEVCEKLKLMLCPLPSVSISDEFRPAPSVRFRLPVLFMVRSEWTVFPLLFAPMLSIRLMEPDENVLFTIREEAVTFTLNGTWTIEPVYFRYPLYSPLIAVVGGDMFSRMSWVQLPWPVVLMVTEV